MSSTVAIIGGGYGGAQVAKSLDAEADVVLIEPRDAFVHAAGSLRALVRPEWAPNMFFSYDNLLERGRVVRDKATAVDARGVTLASGERVEADHIVLAVGSGYPYPAKTETPDRAAALAELAATHEELRKSARVLIFGAGPVGLELAGEIASVWPGKAVTIVDPRESLLDGFDEALRADLLEQLAGLGVRLRLGVRLPEPASEPGVHGVVSTGDEEADIWFRAHGVRTNFLAGFPVNERGRVRVTPRLTVEGHTNVHAVGDVTDVPEAKMAGYAMQHAAVVAENILAALRGEEPTAEYHPSPVPAILLPLGPEGGVGQFPGEGGAWVLPREMVVDYKGRDLFSGRFHELFGTAPVEPDAVAADDTVATTAGTPARHG
ncbi:pyridine nucleotide-disulfide oxidoreductase [Actinorhabdospora filicis]|uniref:Pyridine nucleotide-disulfide oxidoreductase n=1 Tax=Actinorhabdospora filicis TaxID=1785913 RepID=A0A9W6WAG7_9ACTN|nr:FAD-dependent oxidoreductase [Actinorhabdospora filicis]GLZ77615.1 pyridine nucleotide-disulfide oxidoreductase [Actinorhabdospora filicis]